MEASFFRIASTKFARVQVERRTSPTRQGGSASIRYRRCPSDLRGLGEELPAAAVHDQGAVVADEGDALGAAVVAPVDPGGVLPQHVEAVVLEHGLERVGRLGGVVGVADLAARGHHRLRRLRVHDPQGDVDLVDAPVGHQPAGVVPEPPEVEVEAVGVEGPLRGGTEPHVVVDARRAGPSRAARARASSSPGTPTPSPGGCCRACRERTIFSACWYCGPLRCHWPTCTTRPDLRAAASMTRASSIELATGFST